jgi:hypothetical protein
MLRKDSIIIGVLIGVIFPAISAVVAYLLKGNLYLVNKPAVPYLVGIAANLVAMRILSKKDLTDTVKGMMITTFVFMLVTLIFVIHPII